MKIIVGISEMAVSLNQDDVLITYSLGSCLGVSVYDPVTKVGGLLHCMLPLSTIDREKARCKPCMFTDTGMAALLAEVFSRGARRDSLLVKVAGASSLLDDKGIFKIGERNYTVLRKILWKNNMLISSEDVGGTASRTVSLDIGTGTTLVKCAQGEYEL